MQDKYAGDIGDFGKFILLRQISRMGSSQLRLGINWYLTDRTEHKSNDGRHVDYLQNKSEYRDCDPILYNKLRQIVSNSRSVRALERSQILSEGTVFYSEPTPFRSTNFSDRVTYRDKWFEKSLEQLRPVQILFLDPDNGIQTPKVRKT